MATTIALHQDTRRRLAELQERGHYPSMDAVVSALLDAPQHSAGALWARRREAVEAVCKKYGITRLVAFGSRVWGTPHPASDLDLVAEFAVVPGGWAFLDIQDELSAAFGIPVDLHTLNGLRPQLRLDILRRGHPLHA